MRPIKTTHLLIAANVLVFAAMLVVGGPGELRSFSTHTLLVFGADYGPLVREGQVSRLLTSNFIHLNPIHIVMNMVALYQVGLPLEALLGRRRYAVLYVAAGLLGSVASIVWHFREPVVSAGASGAITGLIGAAAVASHRAGDAGIPLRNIMLRWLVTVFVFGAVIHADNAAHLGGLAGGAALAFFFRTTPPEPSTRAGARFETPRLRIVTSGIPPRSSSQPGAESVLLFLVVALAFADAWRHRADASTPAELVNSGVELAQTGRTDDAIRAYRRALQLDPKNAIAWYDLGLALRQKADHEGALAALTRAMELDPTGDARQALVAEHVRHGRQRADEGKLDEAEASMRLGLAVDDGDPSALASLSHVQYQKGDYPASIATLRKAIAVRPSRELQAQLSSTLISAAVALARTDKHAEAVPLYREAIELDPASVIAMYDLGLALFALRDFEGARSVVERSIAVRPRRDAHELLADILDALGKPDKAADLRQTAQTLPEDPH